MEQIIRGYGAFLIEAVVLVLLSLLLFTGITDEEGNRGIFRIAGAFIDTGESITSRQDFDGFLAEASKEKPQITYCGNGALPVGEYAPELLFAAKDADGNEILVQVLHMIDPQGNERGRQELEDAGALGFPISGIYDVTVAAEDAGNRRSVCTVRIPVNG